MKIKLIMIIITTLFISQLNAQYQRSAKESSIGVGPQIGYQRSGDSDSGELMVGAFIRAKLSEAFALDGSINYRGEEYRGGTVTVSSWPVLVSALIYPIPMVYGLAGVGWHFTTIAFEGSSWESDLEDRTSNPFGFHLGAGLELPLGETIKLTGDIKYVFLDYDLENIEDIPLNDLNSNFYIINIGIGFGLR